MRYGTWELGLNFRPRKIATRFRAKGYGSASEGLEYRSQLLGSTYAGGIQVPLQGYIWELFRYYKAMTFSCLGSAVLGWPPGR